MSDESARRAPTERFTTRAQAYAVGRPLYPAGAINAVLEGLGDPSHVVVADVGAGTGISSRLLAERVAQVIAIEPNAAMREEATAHARVSFREGTAEATGLDDGSVDAVTAFQAFHWFDSKAAIAEFRRIARRRAALVQNERDERDAAARAYGAIVRAHATDTTELRRLDARERFARFPNARITRFDVAAEQRLDLRGLLARAESTSYLPQIGETAKTLHEELERFFGEFAASGVVRIALLTTVIRADW